MKKNKFVAMGEYYQNTESLVRTVCRATVFGSNDQMIAYVYVGAQGCASNVHIMPEDEFIKTFC